MSELVLFHRLADAGSARVRAWIVEHGVKFRVDFQNVDTEGEAAFAALGGGEIPALWDGRRLEHGTDAVLLALGAIIPAEEQRR